MLTDHRHFASMLTVIGLIIALDVAVYGGLYLLVTWGLHR